MYCHVCVSILGISITNQPADVTVCMNNVAEIDCGFTGTDPKFVIPNWNITMRSDNGSIVSNRTVLGVEIALNRVSDLQWVPDDISGSNNATTVNY